MRIQPSTVLELAYALLSHRDLQTPVTIRGAALLGRQALEGAVYRLWESHPELEERPATRTQLLCLADLGRELARRTSHSWWALTRACHHHHYEVTPTMGSVRALLDDTRAVVEELASTTELPPAVGAPPG